jgi:pimeloyl-ACP methyl ester carboxylesterase
VTREGAVLAGFSRGGYVAVILAVRHPGRWPFLIVNEADVDLTLPMLQGAGVRAVALIAGERGTQLAGERQTAETLAKEGFPIRLWVMPKVGHAYSTDIEIIMQDALAFLLAHEASSSPDAHGRAAPPESPRGDAH